MRAWEQFKQGQAAELGREIAEKWLGPLQVARYDACNLYLVAQTPFQINWFEEHMREKVKRILVNDNDKPIKVHLSLPANQKAATPKKTKNTPPQFSLAFSPTNAAFSLHSYLFSEENALIKKVLCEITGYDKDTDNFACAPQISHYPFNPLYLYGSKGTGKTHLLQATARALQKQGINALYVTTEMFTDHVVSAIRASEMGHFRGAYRNIDVLIIDDIEGLSRKNATQEEFFHTFNTLHLQGKLILLSSNTLPQKLQHVEPRLISRFEWGLVQQIAPPSESVIQQLLTQLSESLQFTLRPSIREFLLTSFPSYPTACLQALEKLAARVRKKMPHLSSTQLNVESAKLFLKDLLEEQDKDLLTPEKVMKAVAEQYGVTPSDLTGKSQTRESALPRQVAMYILRHSLELPFMGIGDLFKRDHSTVMASVRRIQKLLDEQHPDLLSNYQEISQNLQI